jgi:hypothetical protein
MAPKCQGSSLAPGPLLSEDDLGKESRGLCSDGCVTSGENLPLSGPQFSTLYNGHICCFPAGLDCCLQSEVEEGAHLRGLWF